MYKGRNCSLSSQKGYCSNLLHKVSSERLPVLPLSSSAGHFAVLLGVKDLTQVHFGGSIWRWGQFYLAHAHYFFHPVQNWEQLWSSNIYHQTAIILGIDSNCPWFYTTRRKCQSSKMPNKSLMHSKVWVCVCVIMLFTFTFKIAS